MYSTDPIADMLTRIRNALMRQKSEVIIPHSQIKHQIALILKQYQFIAQFKLGTVDNQKAVIINLTDDQLPLSPIHELKRISTPGRRTHVGWQDIPYVKNGRGLVILSTDRGLMAGFEARRQKLGGEIICSVY